MEAGGYHGDHAALWLLQLQSEHLIRAPPPILQPQHHPSAAPGILGGSVDKQEALSFPLLPLKLLLQDGLLSTEAPPPAVPLRSSGGPHASAAAQAQCCCWLEPEDSAEVLKTQTHKHKKVHQLIGGCAANTQANANVSLG